MPVGALYHLVEKRFDYDSSIAWMSQHWHYSLYSSALYLLLVFVGRIWMQRKRPFHLRRPLVMWNTGLAAFSIMGTTVTIPFLIGDIAVKGLPTAVCHIDIARYPSLALWGFMFALSKFVEFGDTLFIVLRKRQLPFLHYYHHVTVFIYTWYHTSNPTAGGVFFSSVNFFVHSLMYSYYTLSSAGFQLPSRLALFITTLQLSQMFFGIYINVHAYWQKKTLDSTCAIHDDHFYLAMLMYMSYAMLFINFFFQRYVRKKSK